MVPVVSTVPLAVGVAIPRGRAQYALLWASYVWVFKTAWEIPYYKPEKLRRRLHLEYPIRVDAVLGGGVPPGVRLQRTLRDPPRVNVLDAAATAGIYVLWLVPHGVLAWILLSDVQRLPRAAGRLSAVYHLTTLGYWLVPTAPPWWASEQEQTTITGLVEHVTRDVELAVKQRLGGCSSVAVACRTVDAAARAAREHRAALRGACRTRPRRRRAQLRNSSNHPRTSSHMCSMFAGLCKTWPSPQ